LAFESPTGAGDLRPPWTQMWSSRISKQRWLPCGRPLAPMAWLGA